MNIVKLVTEYVPRVFFEEARRTVHEAGALHNDNENRREWSVNLLQKGLHVPEHMARLLVELAVLAHKHERDPASD